MKVYAVKYDWHSTFEDHYNELDGVYLNRVKAEQQVEYVGSQWGHRAWVDEITIDETEPDGRLAHARRMRRLTGKRRW